MFFRTLCVAALVFAFSAEVSQAEMRPSGQPCFDNAVVEAANGGNLQQILQRHISVVNIASSAAWRKWRVRWDTLDEERQIQAIEAVRAALERVSNDFFHDIELETLAARSRPVRYGHQVWGNYQSRGNNSPDVFELGITAQCQVVYVEYNNIRLSSYVANRL